MRNTKELLELMLAHRDLFRAGLCVWADNLWLKKLISDDEYIALRHYIEDNKPNKMFDRGYYWNAGVIAPRIEWINQQIEKL